jgi:hypothetical protein
MNDVILHGEVMIFKCKIPEDAKKVETSGNYHIVAKSEISGNHHVIDLNDGVEFYEKDGVLYMKNTVETKIRCVMTERHDAIPIEKDEWCIDGQREYDYFAELHRRVHD